MDQAIDQSDFQNRPIGAKVTSGGATTNIGYKYDVDGIRVASTVGGSETTLFREL